MTVTLERNGDELTMHVEGRLDTLTSGEFEEKLETSLGGVRHLILDFKELDYISSAGLRTILTAVELMSARGDLKITNVNEDIRETLEITGFLDELDIM